MKIPVNNLVTRVLIVCVVPLFVSCFMQSPYMPYVQPPYIPPIWDRFDAINKVDSIKPGITTKDEVVKRLGRPDVQDRSGKFFQYTGWTDVTIIFVPLSDKVNIEELSRGEGAILYDATNHRVLKPGSAHPGGQRWMVAIRFDENDVVARLSTSKDDDMPENHTQGIDKEAGTYCPNADLGHADAQVHIGNLHYYGAYGESIDLVRAWVWYSLAAKGGDAHAIEKLTQLQAQLSPEQQAEAQRRLAAWQPGQCAQELGPDDRGK